MGEDRRGGSWARSRVNHRSDCRRQREPGQAGERSRKPEVHKQGKLGQKMASDLPHIYKYLEQGRKELDTPLPTRSPACDLSPSSGLGPCLAPPMRGPRSSYSRGVGAGRAKVCMTFKGQGALSKSPHTAANMPGW